jgi:hypothetical protein
MEKKKHDIFDDETLENMKRYYQIESHDELLRYIKKNRLIKGDSEHETSFS